MYFLVPPLANVPCPSGSTCLCMDLVYSVCLCDLLMMMMVMCRIAEMGQPYIIVLNVLSTLSVCATLDDDDDDDDL